MHVPILVACPILPPELVSQLRQVHPMATQAIEFLASLKQSRWTPFSSISSLLNSQRYGGGPLTKGRCGRRHQRRALVLLALMSGEMITAITDISGFFSK